MADISRFLQDILDAIYGEQVRGSIHDAIKIINDVSEVILTTGTDVTSPTSSSEGYFTDSLYFNTDTFELWKCVGTDSWVSQGILKGDPGTPGSDGNKWYRGTGISGKAVNPTVYSGSGIADANSNDLYLNPVEGAVYHCVLGGDPLTATWSYDFTMTGGGGGSVVTWTQIQGSTGSTKIATIDVDGSTQDVYAPSGGGGGMLPYLYIDSEAGATVTVNQPDSTVITPTAAGSGHWECELTGGYGTYVIHSVLSGQGDATQSLVVDTVMEYHVTDTHYDHTISFVAPSGSTVRIEGGTEIYTLTGTGSTQTQAVHSASTSFTVTATMDGNGKPYTFTTPSTTGQTTTIPSGTFDFGTINVSVAADFVTAGSTITCVNGGTSCTPKTAASTLVFRVPTTGTWTISGSVSGQTYSTTATVAALGTPESASLQTLATINVTLYSATEDTVSFTDASGVPRTEVFASGQSSKSVSLKVNPTGSTSITFTSSVALDPENLDGSHYYSKTVSVTTDTTEIYLMPRHDDYMVYWYGYKGNYKTFDAYNVGIVESKNSVYIEDTVPNGASTTDRAPVMYNATEVTAPTIIKTILENKKYTANQGLDIAVAATEYNLTHNAAQTGYTGTNTAPLNVVSLVTSQSALSPSITPNKWNGIHSWNLRGGNVYALWFE